MKKIELLAPAGSLDKAKIALMYGADAVYVGGKKFSLRARASNFTISDIEELCRFAKELEKKVYVTMNIIPHNDDLDDLNTYLKQLEKAGVNGIITSSLYIIRTAKKIAPLLERHVSTQMSVTSSEAVEYWKNIGVKRVVLAREVSLEEMRKIASTSKLELEVFIHGGMCSSYSGRCVLSNHMTDRDANRGGCAHSCRWNYNLYEKSKKLTNSKKYFNIGSKDLIALRFIPSLIDMGIASLKIEGRMKSTYYLATVIRCYRMLIDLYINNKTVSEEEYEWLEKEIGKAENRLTSSGFYKGDVTINEQLYDTRTESPTKEYVACVLDYNEETSVALIEQRNYFETGDLLEAFGPKLENKTFIAPILKDVTTLDEFRVARHPLQQFYIKMPFPVSKFDMIRKVQ